MNSVSVRVLPSPGLRFCLRQTTSTVETGGGRRRCAPHRHNRFERQRLQVRRALDRSVPSETKDKEKGEQKDEAAFAAWLSGELSALPVAAAYPELMSMCESRGVGGAILRWRRRYRGDARLWKRLWKADRVLKEVGEIAPVLDRALRWAASRPAGSPRATVIDLCSGKGYLGMLLSELLPAEAVERIVLVDKSWPVSGSTEVAAHHINWDHIYGAEGCYFHSWPVRLVTSKQDIKKGRTLAKMAEVLLGRAEGPVLLLAVHLCGTLSLRAIDLFNDNPDAVDLLILKPCCLPRPQPDQLFTIGRHTFPGSEVKGTGRFVPHSEDETRWRGPPRWQLGPRFERWTEHLAAGVEVGSSLGGVAVLRLATSPQGGYQNAYLVAQRFPSAGSTTALCEATPLEKSVLVPVGQYSEESRVWGAVDREM